MLSMNFNSHFNDYEANNLEFTISFIFAPPENQFNDIIALVQCHKNYNSFSYDARMGVHITICILSDGWRQILLDFLRFRCFSLLVMHEIHWTLFCAELWIDNNKNECFDESFEALRVFRSAARRNIAKLIFNNLFIFCFFLFDEFMCHFSKRFEVIKRTIKYAAIYDCYLTCLRLFSCFSSFLHSPLLHSQW